MKKGKKEAKVPKIEQLPEQPKPAEVEDKVREIIDFVNR